MKTKYFVSLFILWAALLTGCASGVSGGNRADSNAADASSDTVMVGNYLTIQDIDSRLTLLNNMDALSADGLYYASWTMGASEPYENSDGKTVDLYDAQLYLLSGEFKNSQTAQDNMNTWLDAGKTNYEVSTEEEVTCNGQSYTLITYNCVNEENPYARGASAFGAFQNSAVCIELTCREHFEEDLKAILVDFLEHCTYRE